MGRRATGRGEEGNALPQNQKVMGRSLGNGRGDMFRSVGFETEDVVRRGRGSSCGSGEEEAGFRKKGKKVYG